MRMRMLALLPATLLAAACSADRPTAAPADAAVAFDAVKFWEAGATVAWNERANALAAVRVISANRLYTYLGLAQLRAAEAAYNGTITSGFIGGRPFYLTPGNHLLPPPPPAFGSAAVNTALAEVHQISVTRTAEQIAIANYWNVNASPRSSAAMMGIARELIVSQRRGDAEAARIMFLMASAQFDASIGCFEAKYHYWFIRPPQADAGIVTVFPTPAHPSYPSTHSCGTGAMTAVLAGVFPDERERLEGVAIEASLSRLYAGIHYRFDMDAGLALGRAVAALALAADLDQIAPLP